MQGKSGFGEGAAGDLALSGTAVEGVQDAAIGVGEDDVGCVAPQSDVQEEFLSAVGKLQLDDALLSQLADGVDSGPLDAGFEEFHEAQGLGVLGYCRPGLVDAAGSTCKANQ